MEQLRQRLLGLLLQSRMQSTYILWKFDSDSVVRKFRTLDSTATLIPDEPGLRLRLPLRAHNL